MDTRYQLTTGHHGSLADLGITMGLAPAEAVFLPTVIEVCARTVERTASEMLWEAHKNERLRHYMYGVIKMAMAKVTP